MDCEEEASLKPVHDVTEQKLFHVCTSNKHSALGDVHVQY